jgi:hypothetical protein
MPGRMGCYFESRIVNFSDNIRVFFRYPSKAKECGPVFFLRERAKNAIYICVDSAFVAFPAVFGSSRVCIENVKPFLDVEGEYFHG